MPKEKTPCKCLSMKTLDSVVKTKRKSYPQMLFEECDYAPKSIKMETDLEKSSSDESNSDSGDET